MSTWIQQEIAKWNEWLNDPNVDWTSDSHRVIPPDLQIGKILNYTKGSIHEARRFIMQQCENGEGYWQETLEKFDFMSTNQVMFEE